MDLNGLRRRLATLTISDVVTLAAFAVFLAVPGLQWLQPESRATLSAPFERQTLIPLVAEHCPFEPQLFRSPGTRPIRAAVSPLNPAVFPRPFLVALDQYSNFATVIDVATDTIIGEFQTGFYAEDLIFNRAGTRLYLTDRFAEHVRVFRIEAGPFFTEIGRVPAGTIDLDRASPRDLEPLSVVRRATASAERRPLVRIG